ncbi:MAG TPA: ribosome small subunit-dependent GTPase A [Candidatus Baltobacteraceae bacterium]|jgi:ribosome biogenesis GTPase
MSQTHRARVVSVGKNAAWVVLDEELAPRLAQLKRMTGKRTMLAPGDVVHVQLLEDEKVLVDRIEPRSFTLERRSFDGRAKTMAANVDTMVTVTAFADPPARLVTLDQLLAFAELQSIRPMVIFTKPDLADPRVRSWMVALYGGLGYDVIVINPRAGDNVDDLRAQLQGKHALLCGVSGVGKSSLFRALGGDAVIGDVSRFGLGRQTTSTARLYRLEDGFLIDSPGVAEFGLGQIESPELVQGFREMAEPAARCRFTDCSHLHEPDCGVRAAVADGGIDPSRYASFRKILGGRAGPES